MSPPIAGAHVRIARPTNDLAALKTFYCEGLGFGVLYEFAGHDGFDGLMLGLDSHHYHLEFTKKEGHDAGRAPTQDNLMVFYLADHAAWQAALDRMAAAGYEPVASFNMYWDVKGKTFQDPDGYRVVLQNDTWENKELS